MWRDGRRELARWSAPTGGLARHAGRACTVLLACRLQASPLPQSRRCQRSGTARRRLCGLHVRACLAQQLLRLARPQLPVLHLIHKGGGFGAPADRWRCTGREGVSGRRGRPVLPQRAGQASPGGAGGGGRARRSAGACLAAGCKRGQLHSRRLQAAAAAWSPLPARRRQLHPSLAAPGLLPRPAPSHAACPAARSHRSRPLTLRRPVPKQTPHTRTPRP